ncbi:MAG: hypothetical protein SYC29_06690 [Planctomycetota bacterium]|nr:hypothetical protein [Planctomycetota bacterium]
MQARQRRRTIVIMIILGIAVLMGVALFVQALGRAGGSGGGVRVMPAVIAAFLIGVGVVVVIIVIIVRAANRRHLQTIAGPEEVAARLGLAYEDKAEKGFHRAFGPLPGIPRSGRVQHVFTGSLDDRPVTAFQHFYMITTGQATVPIYHTVCVVEAPNWPPTRIGRRNLLSRLLYRVGRRGGLLLEDESFNATRTVKAADEDFALALLHPEMQRFITAHPDAVWQINPGHVALVAGGQMTFDRLDDRLQCLREFRRLVPEELKAW